jgi:hypothetical protein
MKTEYYVNKKSLSLDYKFTSDDGKSTWFSGKMPEGSLDDYEIFNTEKEANNYIASHQPSGDWTGSENSNRQYSEPPPNAKDYMLNETYRYNHTASFATIYGNNIQIFKYQDEKYVKLNEVSMLIEKLFSNKDEDKKPATFKEEQPTHRPYAGEKETKLAKEKGMKWSEAGYYFDKNCYEYDYIDGKFVKTVHPYKPYIPNKPEINWKSDIDQLISSIIQQHYPDCKLVATESLGLTKHSIINSREATICSASMVINNDTSVGFEIFNQRLNTMKYKLLSELLSNLADPKY